MKYILILSVALVIITTGVIMFVVDSRHDALRNEAVRIERLKEIQEASGKHTIWRRRCGQTTITAKTNWRCKNGDGNMYDMFER